MMFDRDEIRMFDKDEIAYGVRWEWDGVRRCCIRWEWDRELKRMVATAIQIPGRPVELIPRRSAEVAG